MEKNVPSEADEKSFSAAKIAFCVSIIALLLDVMAAVAVCSNANPNGSGFLDSYSSIFFTILGWLVPLAGLILGIAGKKENAETASKAIFFSITSLVFFGAAYIFLPKIMLP
jgi:cytochrome bd-type quinol oxidase subunit 2